MTEATFQQRVDVWMHDCFGAEITHDPVERNFRFLEEVLETVQANGFTMDQAHFLVDYVFGRPVGEVHLEAGGAMVTLAALCTAAGVNLKKAAEAELIRIEPMKAKIAAKQKTKPRSSPPLGIDVDRVETDPASHYSLQVSIAAAAVLAGYGLVATASQHEAFSRMVEGDPRFRWFLWDEAIAAARDPITEHTVADAEAWTGSFAAMLARFGRYAGSVPTVSERAIDPIASGVHAYWRGASGKMAWDALKVDMPGQAAMFRALATRALRSDGMASWKLKCDGATAEEAVRDLALALYHEWNPWPREEPWSPVLERVFVGKASAAIRALTTSGFGLVKIRK